jgi:glycosyltransferase involved in cell wall biosynthesis
MLRIIYFYPHNLEPTKIGADRRCREILRGFRDLGHRVVLLSSSLSSHTLWTTAAMEALERQLVSEVRLFTPGFLDLKWRGLIHRYYASRGRLPSLFSSFWTPFGMRRWFAAICREVHPDVVVMSYAQWDGLVPHGALSGSHRIIDSLDIMTLNSQMQSALTPYFSDSPIRIAEVPAEASDEGFFATRSCTPDSREFRIFDHYDTTVAISQPDAKLITNNTHRTKVNYIPVTLEPVMLANGYSGPALFPIGPNLFNLQGLAYFSRKVLPTVRNAVADFDLVVCGNSYGNLGLSLERGMRFLGFVRDISSLYANARFAICPVFGGTGQQIKIVEAMAHGVPVVALRGPANTSPIRHGENGLVAGGAAEFAEHVVKLWCDRDLCRRLGHAARETISTTFSTSRLRRDLDDLLGEDHPTTRSDAAHNQAQSRSEP